VLLPDKILERLWAPLAGYDLVAHLSVSFFAIPPVFFGVSAKE
jgi:hypothetical protein